MDSDFKFLVSKPLFWIMIVLVASLVVYFYFFLFPKSQNESVIRRGKIFSFLSATGKMNADTKADLSFKTSGKVEMVRVKDGEEVTKGQTLAQLDTVQLNATYQEALNTYRQYQATAQNILDQVKNHSSDETYSQKDTRTTAEVNRDNAYDAVLSAKDALDNATIRAPFAGIVVTQDLEVGEWVSAFSLNPQIVVVDPESIYFSAEVDQKEIGDVKVGQKAKVSFDAYPNQDFTSEVYQVAKTTRETDSGSIVEVKIKLDSPPEFIIGLKGDVQVILEEKDNVLLIPKNATYKKDGASFVRTPGGEKQVKLGVFDGTNWEVVAGVNEGEKVKW